MHHLALGFTTVYIFDHRSTRPVKNVVSDLQNVIVERLEMPFANKMRLMIAAARYANINQYDWLMYLDGDEVLFMRDHDSVESYLSQFPENVHQIGINWLLFGSNYLEKTPINLIHSYTRSEKCLHDEVKVFVRPSMVNLKIWPSPHCYALKEDGHSIGWDGGSLEGPLYKDQSGQDFHKASAYIAHYIVQSYDSYVCRKLSRQRDDVPDAKWPVIPKNTFHDQFNDVVNTDLSDKYQDYGRILFVNKEEEPRVEYLSSSKSPESQPSTSTEPVTITESQPSQPKPSMRINYHILQHMQRKNIGRF